MICNAKEQQKSFVADDFWLKLILSPNTNIVNIATVIESSLLFRVCWSMPSYSFDVNKGAQKRILLILCSEVVECVDEIFSICFINSFKTL